MKWISLTVLSLALSGAVLACSEDGKSGFLPENNLRIPADSLYVGGLSEAQFNAVIDKVEAIYVPIVSNMGGNLKIARKWTDATVNANATRAGAWNVNMYGGLARHETITEDGFALVLCHEIGHHIGGAPKVKGLLNRWASNEGQSDYFATLKCLRQTFLNDNNQAIVKTLNAPEVLVKSCAKAWPNKDDSAICVRGGMAGHSVSKLFQALRQSTVEPKFDTPDSAIVAKTDDKHPATQCRLDTFFQGALCEKGMNEDVSQTDELKGTCNTSQGQTAGVRPLCWFKPKS